MAFLILSLFSLHSTGSPIAVLKEETVITTGNQHFTVSGGTTVSVLKTGGAFAVVALTLPDGTPVITQLPSNSISTSGDKSTDFLEKPSRVATGGVSSSQHSTPAAAPSQEVVQPAVSDSTDSTAYPQFKLPSDASGSGLPGVKYAIQTGTFQIPINNTFATVVYAIPMDGTKQAASASNLIFYGPYPNEKTKLTGNVVPDLVRKLGCSVFSFQFDGLGQSVSDTPYWFKSAGWIEAALRARDILVRKFALEPRGLILVGYSGGAGMIMNFAGAYPDQVDAVAAQAPNVVPDFPAGNKIKWLLVVNRGDTNRAVMRPFYELLRSDNCDALFCETTPDRNRGHYHNPSGQTYELIYTFIAGVLDQRRLSDDRDADFVHLWPYAAPSLPLQRYAIVKTSDLRPEDLQNGHFDFLPSLAFTLRWSQVCPPEQPVVIGDNHTRLTLNFPARKVPAGVVFYYDNAAYPDIPREVEDINSLAEHGYLVISSLTADPEAFVKAAAAWIHSQDALRGLHIHLVGNGVPGARFISKVLERNDISFKTVSVIDFNESWLQADCLDQVNSAAKECGMYGFYSYSDSDSKSCLESWADTLVDKGAQERGCFNICSKPVPKADVTESSRHLKAEDQALALIKSLIARADTN